MRLAFTRNHHSGPFQFSQMRPSKMQPAVSLRHRASRQVGSAMQYTRATTRFRVPFNHACRTQMMKQMKNRIQQFNYGELEEKQLLVFDEMTVNF